MTTKITRKQVPMQVRHIDDSNFLQRVDEAFAKAQQRLIRHVAKYGEKSKGACASLSISIKIKAEEPSQNFFVVVGKITESLPQRPLSGKVVNSGASDTGEVCLIAQDTVDAATGEVMLTGM